MGFSIVELLKFIEIQPENIRIDWTNIFGPLTILLNRWMYTVTILLGRHTLSQILKSTK